MLFKQMREKQKMQKMQKKRNTPRTLYAVSSLLLIGMSSLIIPNMSLASMSSDMQNFFNKSGFAANVTSAKAVMGQEAGHLSGGSGFVRTGNKHIQFLNVQAPNLKFGCGTIDWVTGGLGFVSTNEMIEMGQAVMKNAAPYAFDLALTTWAPTVKSTMADLRKLAADLNAMNVSSCELAESAVNGIKGWFESKNSKEFVCKSFGTTANKFSTWLESEDFCKRPDVAVQKNEEAKKDPSLADVVKQNRNLVWYFLMKDAFLKSNTEVAQYVMSLTGTLINIAENDQIKLKKLEPLIVDEKSAGFDLMLHGKPQDGKKQEVKIYKCDDLAQEACKAPTIQDLVIADTAALVPKLTTMLQSMGEKLVTDKSLTPAEQGIVNAVNFPILQIIKTEIMAGWTPEYYAYAEILARILLSEYISQIISVARTALRQNDLGDDNDLQWLMDNLNRAQRNVILQINDTAYKNLRQKSDLVLRSLQVENIVIGDMSVTTQMNMFYGKTL